MKPVKLNLSEHCIQTEIKRLYNQSFSDYFKKDADKEHLEQRLELLKSALETFDFQKLRSRYVELSGGGDKEALFEPTGKSQFDIELCIGATGVVGPFRRRRCVRSGWGGSVWRGAGGAVARP